MYEIFTFGNGVMLGSLFQAIAAMTSTADYLELIRLIFVVATLIVAIEVTWTGRFKPTARLLTIIFMMNLAILTTADVTITDQVNSANNSTVADVPAGLAAPLALATAIGNWGATSFETIFSLPNDLRYQSNGLLFASRLAEATTQFEVTDSRMANNLAEFAQGCIYYGIMADWFTIETVMESADIWASLPAASFGNAIFVNNEDSSGTVAMDGCRNVRTKIEADWSNAIDEMTSVYGQRIFPSYAEADAKARLLSSIPQSYQFMANISDSAADIVRQNAMINAMRRSFTNMANNAGSPGAAQDYALAQAEAQQRTTYATLGALAGRMMSLFKNVLEVLLYGVFPIAFIFSIAALMQGKAVVMYFKLLFWLQLWPPMFAILNFAMVTYAAESTTAAAMQAGGGSAILNMMTYTGMRAVNSDMSAMAGYMSWMIPMFSWALVSGTGYAASQLAASLGSVAQASGSSAASSASSGNISLGNYSGYNNRQFQDVSSPTMSRGFGTSVNSETGAKITTSAGGYQTISTPQNSTPFMANLSNAIRSSTSTSASQSVQAAKTAASSFASQTHSTYSNMQKLAQGSSTGTGTSSGNDTGRSSQFSKSFAEMDKLAEQFANKHGMSKGQAASMLLAASMDSNKMLVGMGFAAATGLGGRAQVDFQGKSSSSEDWNAAKEFASQRQFGKKWDEATQAGEKQAQQQSQNSQDAQSKDIAAGFNRQQSAQQNLQSSLTQAQAWQRLSAKMEEAGGSGSVNAVGALMQFGRSQGVNMEQLAVQSSNINGAGAAAASRQLQQVVNAFVQNEAAGMAGVGPAPTSGSVSQAKQANDSAVVAATESPSPPPGSGNVLANAGDNMATVREMAAQAGVPSSDMVGKSANEIQQLAEQRMASQGGQVNSGGDQVTNGGAPLRQDAEKQTDSSNQSHMVNAMGEVASAGADVITDAVGGLKQAGGQIVDRFIQSPNNTQSQSGGDSAKPAPWSGYENDLPPPVEDEGGNKGKAWVNRLD